VGRDASTLSCAVRVGKTERERSQVFGKMEKLRQILMDIQVFKA
jgi:hypothetical protein